MRRSVPAGKTERSRVFSPGKPEKRPRTKGAAEFIESGSARPTGGGSGLPRRRSNAGEETASSRRTFRGGAIKNRSRVDTRNDPQEFLDLALVRTSRGTPRCPEMSAAGFCWSRCERKSRFIPCRMRQAGTQSGDGSWPRVSREVTAKKRNRRRTRTRKSRARHRLRPSRHNPTRKCLAEQRGPERDRVPEFHRPGRDPRRATGTSSA
jgi:hypothetical protein